MKRIVLWIVAILLFAAIIVKAIVWGIDYAKTMEVGGFKLSDYSFFIESTAFDFDRKLGTIDSAKDARKKAEAVWVELYGEKIKDRKPYRVFYDEQNQAWLVVGSSNNILGGVPYIIIQKMNGKILAVGRDK